jgi:hypothetical protein
LRFLPFTAAAASSEVRLTRRREPSCDCPKL